MTHIITLPKRDMSLQTLSDQGILELLEKTGISKEYYESQIQPFIESLGGEYKVEGRLITDYWFFTRTKFTTPFFSLTKTKDFLEGGDSLEMLIQDLKSFNIENEIKQALSESNTNYSDPLVRYGSVFQKYKKQTGVLRIVHEKDNSNKQIILGEIANYSMPRSTKQLSDFTIDKILQP